MQLVYMMLHFSVTLSVAGIGRNVLRVATASSLLAIWLLKRFPRSTSERSVKPATHFPFVIGFRLGKAAHIRPPKAFIACCLLEG
jgi:hypothetical protein